MITKVLLAICAAAFSLGHLQATQIDIPGPAGSGTFGRSVTVLPNGNFVVTDPTFDAPGPIADVGAVYLYDGATLALISTLTGGTASDQISDFLNVKVLSNGNFVVLSPSWDNPAGSADVGAVTWCSATTGCNGVVSASNSLIGSTANDFLGGFVTELSNGNYVVASRGWDNPSPAKVDVGAATFCNGTTGCTGAVSAVNSLIGSTANDVVGGFITVLTSSNYVVRTGTWDNPTGPIVDAGAATFCNGTTGCTGAVSASNSLIGAATGNGVGGSGVTALSNGKYVVGSSNWDNPSPATTNVGAATLCNGTTGCTGPVTAANSLIGSTTNDSVGLVVTALTNGNYVVSSRNWDNPAPVRPDVGAVTFCPGTTGCTGVVVSAANSLIGGTAGDLVPDSAGGVTVLTNGNYVVKSSVWDNPSLGANNDAGAATWGNGTGGTIGLVSSGNSLVGGMAADNVGSIGVTALTNGNYVVDSRLWDNPAGPITNVGAVTWGNGTGGTVGVVTTSNSLVGGSFSDQIGLNGVTALSNGNYVVCSQQWTNPTGPVAVAGAATFCNGTSGCTGLVTTSNSLVGGTVLDQVGNNGAVALSNGNYVVRSTLWENPVGPIADVGAATWGNGTGGTFGLVTSGNSLVGGTDSDQVGRDGVTALPNGNYTVSSLLWDNGMIGNAGAVTFGNGTGGTVGPITAADSILGTVGAGITPPALGVSYDAVRNRLFVGRSASNIASILSGLQLTTAVSRKVHGATPFDINLPLSGEPGVECRSGAAGHSLVFNLSANVVSGSATVTAGTGTAGVPTFAGNTMTVPLTGVSDIQKITVTLNSVTDVNAQVLPSTAVSMNVLLGDTTGNKNVNASDVGATKAQSGVAVSAANFRNDTNVSNSINASDIGQVKAASGHSVP